MAPESEELSNILLEVIPIAMRKIRAEMRGLAQPELSVAQFRILARLDLKPHSNKELAEWVGVSTAAMSRTVDVLVKRGLIQRKSTRSDRREVELTLTHAGKKKFNTIKAATRRKLVEKLRPLGAGERSKLNDGLALLSEIFHCG